MIELKNQVCIQFSVGPFTDFVSLDDFYYMDIKINTGGLRPILNVEFVVTADEIIPYLNTGNIITISFGTKELMSKPWQFQIESLIKEQEYNYGSRFIIMASMYNPKFTSTRKSESRLYKGLKSWEVISLIAINNGFAFTSNVTKTNDVQNWSQDGKTDWQFLDEVADKAFLDTNTFFSYGFDNHTIYFYNMKQQISTGPKWKLTVNGASPEHPEQGVINIGGYYPDDSNVGTTAELAGKNDKIVGYDFDSGEFSNPEYKLKTYTTMDTNKINMNSVDCQEYTYQYTNGDKHGNSMLAVNQNLRNNILFSSHTVYVPLTDTYRNFGLLDVVQLDPFITDKACEGIYLISGIVYQYTGNKFTTNLTLNREGPNGIKSDNLQAGE